MRTFLATYKVQECKRQDHHDFASCLDHHGDNDRRRNPCASQYSPSEACSPQEKHFHPMLYRTGMCKLAGRGRRCSRGTLCAFAHSPSELRDPGSVEYGASFQDAPSPQPLLLHHAMAAAAGKQALRKPAAPASSKTFQWGTGGPPAHSRTPSGHHELRAKLSAWQEFLWRQSAWLQGRVFQASVGVCAFTQEQGRDTRTGHVKTIDLVFSGNDPTEPYFACMQLLTGTLPPNVVKTQCHQCPAKVIARLSQEKRQDCTGGMRFSRRFSDAANIWVDVNVESSTVAVLEVVQDGATDRGFRGMEVFKRTEAWVGMEAAQYKQTWECAACLDTFPEADCITCDGGMGSGQHCFCQSTCLGALVEAQLPALRAQEGVLKCPVCAATIQMRAVAAKAPEGVHRKLSAAVVDSKLEARCAELETAFDERLKEKIAGIMKDYESGSGKTAMRKLEAEALAKRARDDALNLACPHCKAVYADFDGCMALACASCGKFFCAYCHSGYTSSQGAHDHARECLHNETSNGSIYASPQQLATAQRKHRTRTLKKFLREVKRDLQNATIIELSRDLKDLDIDAAALFQFSNLADGEPTFPVQMPKSWGAHHTEPKVVPLSRGNEEYQGVEEHFRRTAGDTFAVLKIERVQHPALFKQYAAYRDVVAQGNGGDACEKRLFHGTDKATMNKINHGANQCFNRTFTHTHAYGKGVYFARDALYSADPRYSKPGPGAQLMYRARVAVGAFTRGQRNLTDAPERANLQLYDSVVDNMSDPSIFVVFRDAAAYPEYVIHFQEAGR